MLVRLRAIGECGIAVGEGHVGPDAELAFALLLILVLAGGHRVARRRLTDLLWPATSDDRARHNLRQTLYKLRQLGVPVESESLHVWLPVEAVAPHPLRDGDADGDAAPSELLRADRPFGEFLAGYAPTFSAPYAAWVDEQRSVAHARLRRVALTQLHDERRRGRWAAVEMLARKVLQLDPLNEDATLALAEATVMTGSKRAALALLDAYVRDLGPDAGDIRLPATRLRRRIAERLPPSLAPPDGDACFVGREESMAFLHDQFRAARATAARAVLLWGDAGIGKSRLTTEFARLAVMEGAQIARVGCQARDVERPLSLFVDIVQHLLALPGAIGCSPESMTYLRRLTAHDPTVVEPAAETREAELLFAYVRRAILDLVDAVASESALILVFEDVHWLDEQSWRVLRELIGWLERRRVLVLLTSRLPHATPTPPARTAPGVVEHRLDPLDRAASAALFDAVTGGGVVPAEYREWCVDVADGNPLFVCSLGAYWITTRQQSAPAELTRLIGERLKTLSDHALRVLQACAVLDNHSTFDNLERVLEMSRTDLLRCMEQLSYHHLLGGTGTKLQCKHSLIRDSALRTLCDATRRLLYRCKAETIMTSNAPAISASVLWAGAEAWLACGDRARALELIVSCGYHLQSVGLADDAVGIYQRALEADLEDHEALVITKRLASALEATGNWARLYEVATAHRVASRVIPESKHVFTVRRLKATWHMSGGRLSSSVLRALRKYCRSRAVSAEMRGYAAGFGVAVADNCCRQADLDYFTDFVFRILSGPMADARVLCEPLTIYHTGRGDLGQGVRLAQEMISHDRAQADSVTLARTLRIASIPMRRMGLFDEAEAATREAFTIAAKVGAYAQAIAAVEALCYVFFEQGRPDDVAIWLEHAEALVARHNGGTIPLPLIVAKARLALERGSIAESDLHGVAFPKTIGSDVVTRRRALMLAMKTHAFLLHRRESEAMQELSDLQSTFEQTKSWGGQDYCAWVLCSTLARVNLTDQSMSVANEYVYSTRREVYPVPERLRQFTSN